MYFGTLKVNLFCYKLYNNITLCNGMCTTGISVPLGGYMLWAMKSLYTIDIVDSTTPISNMICPLLQCTHSYLYNRKIKNMILSCRRIGQELSSFVLCINANHYFLLIIKYLWSHLHLLLNGKKQNEQSLAFEMKEIFVLWI